MGGHAPMQWAVDFPPTSSGAIVIAAGAVASAEQIALCWLQSQAIASTRTSATATITTRHAGPVARLGNRPRIGHLSYRSEVELQRRFSNNSQDHGTPLNSGRYAVEFIS